MFGHLLNRCRRRRPRARPALESLDTRVLPAPLGSAALTGGRVGPPGQVRFGSGLGVPAFEHPAPAPRGQGLTLANHPGRAAPVAAPTSPTDFPSGPGGYYTIVNTPGGPAGLRSVPRPFRALRPVAAPVTPQATTQPGAIQAPTSPTDFPFGPGGYDRIVETPSGPAGLRGIRR